MTIDEIREEFEEKYQRFELCENISKDDMKRLGDYIVEIIIRKNREHASKLSEVDSFTAINLFGGENVDELKKMIEERLSMAIGKKLGEEGYIKFLHDIQDDPSKIGKIFTISGKVTIFEK